MKKNLLPLLGIAFAVAVLATALFYSLFLSKFHSGSGAAAGPPTLVAARNLDRGTQLKPEDLKVITWGSPEGIKGGFSKTDQVAGMSLLQPLVENEPVTESRVASLKSGGGAGLGIPAGMRAVSIHVVDSSGVVSMLRPGHKVDIQVVGNPSSQRLDDVRIQTMLQRIEVLFVNPQPEASTARYAGPVLTLLATPAEADLLGLADSLARIRVLLRNPLDDQKSRLPVVAQPALFRYAAPVPQSEILSAARTAPPRPLLAPPASAATRVSLNIPRGETCPPRPLCR